MDIHYIIDMRNITRINCKMHKYSIFDCGTSTVGEGVMIMHGIKNIIWNGHGLKTVN
jgi:hypothetical protein